MAQSMLVPMPISVGGTQRELQSCRYCVRFFGSHDELSVGSLKFDCKKVSTQFSGVLKTAMLFFERRLDGRSRTKSYDSLGQKRFLCRHHTFRPRADDGDQLSSRQRRFADGAFADGARR